MVCVLGTLGTNDFEERRHFAYTEYCRFKDDFFDFLGYVPLVKKNLTVFSPKLSSLITDVCEQILDCLETWVAAPRETVKHLGMSTTLLNMTNTKPKKAQT